MKMGCSIVAFMLVLAILSDLKPTFGIRFAMDREECLSHDVKYASDTVQVSFVVIKYDSGWNDAKQLGVDLVVRGPSGEQIRDFRDKISEKFEFVAHEKGVHRFCFTNKSPYYETIDFDVTENHFTVSDELAKDEHFKPAEKHLIGLKYALNNIQFAHHWLASEQNRQQLIYESMSKRTMHKALFESAALIAASILQVYLLRRLFNKKQTTRV